MKDYRKYLELTLEQQKTAEKKAFHLGYKPEDLLKLSYGIDESMRVISIRDDNLLTNVFPTLK